MYMSYGEINSICGALPKSLPINIFRFSVTACDLYLRMLINQIVSKISDEKKKGNDNY